MSSKGIAMAWTALLPVFPPRASAQAWSESWIESTKDKPGVYEIGFLLPGFRTPHHTDTSNGYPDNFRPVYIGKDKKLLTRIRSHAKSSSNLFIRTFTSIHADLLSAGDCDPVLRAGLFASCHALENEQAAARMESERIIKGMREHWYGWNRRREWKPKEDDYLLHLHRRLAQPSNQALQRAWSQLKTASRSRATVLIGGDRIPSLLANYGLWPD